MDTKIDINKIATLANGLRKKPTAVDKLTAVKRLIEFCNESAQATGYYPNEVHTALITLYAQHVPPTPAKPKTAFDWAYKAVAKKDIRYYLNAAHVDDNGQLQCTDGHRVHLAATMLAPGFYDKAQTAVAIDGRFPDVHRVIPQDKEIGRTKDRDITKTELLAGRQVLINDFTTTVIREPGTINPEDRGLSINTKYLKDALCNPADLVETSIPGNSTSSVRLTFKDGSMAVLMPIRA